MPPPSAPPPVAPFDLVIRGGTLLDGTGQPPTPADVGVRGDRIAAIGDLAHADGTFVIAAIGRLVCPGFIDLHTHSDNSLRYSPGIDSSLAQAVTTEIVGNCGFSLGLARP